MLLSTCPPILLLLLFKIMKAILLPENITPYIALFSKILPTHSQVPILMNLLIEAGGGGLILKATDLDVGAEIKILAKVEEEGSITVPGKEFLETINSLPKDKLTISLKDEILTVSSRGSRIAFNTIPSSEFPQLYKEKGEEVVRFTHQEFTDNFSYLTFSVSFDESRPQLTGVFLDAKEGGVNFVSTDGYRMSIKRIPQKKKIKEKLIVGVGLINEVVTLKNTDEIIFNINKSESQVVCEVGDVVVVGRMIEGNFPDYEKVIPKDSQTIVVFDREDLLRNVRLASVFARDNSNIASLLIEGSTMKIVTKAQGVGQGELVVDCEKEGEDGKIAFNIKYLLDLLKTVSEEKITLKLNGPTEPALFEVEGKDYSHVIMPIQVD